MATRDKAASRSRILGSAAQLIKQHGARKITVDAVAREAGCAKGLVHYHFKTKRGLLQAAAEQLAQERESAWRSAFEAAEPRQAIDSGWRLLADESTRGTLRGWLSLYTSESPLPDSAVKNAQAAFSRALGNAVERMMRRHGMAPTIPAGELGWLLAGVLNGIGLELVSGLDRGELEGAYAAAWLGVLSLFRSAGT